MKLIPQGHSLAVKPPLRGEIEYKIVFRKFIAVKR